MMAVQKSEIISQVRFHGRKPAKKISKKYFFIMFLKIGHLELLIVQVKAENHVKLAYFLNFSRIMDQKRQN